VLGLTTDLLAPGDSKSAAVDPAQFSWTRIRDVNHPRFRAAYDALWAEFGAAHEMETIEVLTGRFAHAVRMQYEMVLVERGGEFAGVRDHTAIWIEGEVVVHLSHVVVAEPWRRSGLAGWLRAVPILTARELAGRLGATDCAITLVGEMEYDDGTDPKRAIRLAAYERAGYRKVAPGVVNYFQPDFRSPADIDAAGGAQLLPFQLIVRQVGRETDAAVTAERAQRWVRALYAMYGTQFRASDMAHPRLSLTHYPADNQMIPLIPPTQC
jgi:hypothetical protein